MPAKCPWRRRAALIVACVFAGVARTGLGQATNTIFTPYMRVTTLAGVAGSGAPTDGTGTNARMFGPNGVAMDSAGVCYDADWLSNRVRRITPGGVVTTLAGGGGGTGTTAGMTFATGTAALFNQPAGLGIDSNNVLYLTTNANCVISAITTPGAVVTHFAGGNGGTTCGYAQAPPLCPQLIRATTASARSLPRAS